MHRYLFQTRHCHRICNDLQRSHMCTFYDGFPSGRDLKNFLSVIVGLLDFPIVGSWANFLKLFYIGLMCTNHSICCLEDLLQICSGKISGGGGMVTRCWNLLDGGILLSKELFEQKI
ncbi:uncharacterized protein LOC131651643 [Vicia villosa]|uniref:uncharacterized protein LOC131651643 n=1 Tax=Vicia villosa TaxID=3911 RepID=UPI00273B99E0|nr:uncharacterized protein LOC131651643 [Vicia villosa]